MKKFITILCSFFLVLSLNGCDTKKETSDTLKIVATNFPGYDFARSVTNNSDDITMLLKPGQESHNYDPTPQDIIKIEEADLFIYTGGESDTWVNNMLNSIDNNDLVCIRMMDYVSVYKEEVIEGMQEDLHDHEEDGDHEEYDEHVWTSPMNAIHIIEAIEKEVISLDKENTDTYKENANTYIKKIQDIDSEIKKIVENSNRKELIFGDRFPFRYFVETYGLSYYAAFPGCSSETEINAKTIAFLVDKTKKDNIPVVFHIELSNTDIAQTIADEAGVKVLQLHSIHNVTEADFLANKTYIDLMKQNVENLKEALQ